MSNLDHAVFCDVSYTQPRNFVANLLSALPPARPSLQIRLFLPFGGSF